MFKRRLREVGKVLLLAVSLLFVGGSLQSCRDWLDDYKYDDSEPDWLGESIYAFLKKGTANCTYNNLIELIDSLGEKETLNYTGSKTLFAADDKAFERFFAKDGNPWGVTSVADMTKSQMRLLLYGSMLDNALLLDMMANTGANVENEGLCLRRTTSLDVLDTVPLVNGDSYKHHKNWPSYNKYWDALRGGDREKSLRLAMDASTPMMVHFLDDYLKRNAVTVEDINFLFKKTGENSKQYKEGSVSIFGSQILASDVSYGDFSDDTLTVACKNGYVYRIDDVLIQPSNMASEIRQRSDLRIFSHLLDRFCIPVYNDQLTVDYRERYETQDSVFGLRYFNSKDFTGYSLLEDMTLLPGELLIFDPGKNDYASNLGRESDMAAMFVPKDSVLYEFFAYKNDGSDENDKRGAGNFLLERFAPNVHVESTYSEANLPALLQALDSVPQLNIAPFLNNLMKPSFVNTVKSKFDKITDDANDDMKLRENHVDECIVANNGVVYLLNEVFSPAAYVAVTAPALVNDNMTIMYNVINQLSYDSYLLAMDAKYSLIIPDNGKFRYFDPVSFVSPNDPKQYEFHFDNKREKGKGDVAEFWYSEYEVNSGDLKIKRDTLNKIEKVELGPIGVAGTNFGGNNFLVNRMTDLLDYLIIVHNEEEPSIREDKMYYLTKGFGTIKIDASDKTQIKFQGGEQLENNEVIVAKEVKKQRNGETYSTMPVNVDEDSVRLYSSVPTPSRRSVRDNILAYGKEEGDLYKEFYDLCNFKYGKSSFGLEKLYNKLVSGDSSDEMVEDSVRIYSIFYTTPKPSAGTLETKIVDAVPFLNTYHYTVYIPSNESLAQLYAEGFPTWKDVNSELGSGNLGRASSLVRLINGFIRNHFQDYSLYCDKCAIEEDSYPTSVVDPNTGRFYENVVKSEMDGERFVIKVKDPLSVKENKDEWATVVTSGDENKTWNVMCRDIVYSMGAEKPNGISTSSFSVLQPIDRVLRTPAMYGFDGSFARFAKSGEKIDTMTIAGGEGGLAIDKNGVKFDDDCYLVAKICNSTVLLPDGTAEKVNPNDKNSKDKVHTIAYLMKPLDNAKNPNIEKEEYVLNRSQKNILITEEGYLVTSEEKVTDKDEKYTIYKYITIGNEGEKKIQRVDNSGNVIERVLIELPTSGTDNSGDTAAN